MENYADLNVIYSDPAWTFKTHSDKGLGRSAQAHYDCMSISDIKNIPVRNWGHSGTALIMWATDPLLPQALEVMEAWDFKYTTILFYWAKLNKSIPEDQRMIDVEKDFFMSTGYYTRANPELCLLGTRKKKPKRLNRDVRKLIVSPRREHSRKPEQAYERIERLFDGPYGEMFARSSRPGWSILYGNQADLFDQGHVETRRLPSDMTTISEISPA